MAKSISGPRRSIMKRGSKMPCCATIPILLYNRNLVFSIIQSNFGYAPDNIVIGTGNASPAAYHFGIVDVSTGLVFKVSSFTGTPSEADTQVNLTLVDWLNDTDFVENRQYTLFIVGHTGSSSPAMLKVGDLYSGLSSLWVKVEFVNFIAVRLLFGIVQSNVANRPTAFAIDAFNDNPATYHFGIVNKTTGLVIESRDVFGSPASALATANAYLATWLTDASYVAATEYTVFITGIARGTVPPQLLTGDPYANLAAAWGAVQSKCFRVLTVTSGVISTTAACV